MKLAEEKTAQPRSGIFGRSVAWSRAAWRNFRASPAPEAPHPPDRNTAAIRRWSLLLIVLAPAVFAVVTGNIWEDFFITFRCSLNLVQGDGLVFEAGRRLHVFTSPLGTLLPAGISWLTGIDHPETVLNLFRVLACGALAGAWALAAERIFHGDAAPSPRDRLGALSGSTLLTTLSQSKGLPNGPRFPRTPGRGRPGSNKEREKGVHGGYEISGLGVALGLWALDAKLAAFSTNGMETAFLVLFVLLAWRSLLDGHLGWAGVALGGALWTRPDGFVFVGAIVAGVVLFPSDQRPDWRGWLRMAGVAALIYTPWFAWAWSYYGSPVPNTILAKGAYLEAGELIHRFLIYPWNLAFGGSPAHDAFLPPYFFFGGWPGFIHGFGRVLALTAAAAPLWPGCPRPARVAGLAFVIGGAYLTATPQAPWYFPAWQVLAYLAVAGVVAGLAKRLGSRLLPRIALGAGVTAVLLVQAWLFVSVAAQLRAQQAIIEWGVRAPLGRAIGEAARHSSETVFLEPLGYIGFFSGLAMRDTPGLCAPEVIALRKTGIQSMAELVAALRPDWTVLRMEEYARFSAAEKLAFRRDYEFWVERDARAEIAAVAWLPGREFLMFDAFYTVWRRRVEPSLHP